MQVNIHAKAVTIRGPEVLSYHDRIVAKSDEAKWAKLTKITLVGSFFRGNTHGSEKIRRGDGLTCPCSSYGYAYEKQETL